jgi:hypothetical protein
VYSKSDVQYLHLFLGVGPKAHSFVLVWFLNFADSCSFLEDFMQLHEFIRTHHDSIEREWEHFARTLTPA